MRRVLIGLAALSLLPVVLLGAMSDAKAALEVNKLWGASGFIALKPRVRADSNWTRQVGFLSPGCETPYRVVGEGFNTWDAAFAAMPADKGIQGTYSGLRTIRVDVNTENMTAPASLQVMIDGQPYQTPILVQTGQPVDLMFDSSQYADGFHVLCGILSYVDATATKALITHQTASMFIVKQVPVVGNTGPAPQLPLIVHLGLEGWPPAFP